MNVRMKFLGGAGTVTGSRHLVEVDNFTLLVDCGMFQGLKELRLKNWEPFPVDPESIDAIVITHAHIDHTGYLPRIVNQGFQGPIYCTEATADLMELLLMDSAKLQEEEAAFAKKKGYSKHEDPKPLYNSDDVAKVLPLIKTCDYNQVIQIEPRIQATFHNAGHILGASIVEMELTGSYQKKKIVFSGDLGRFHDPMLEAPTKISNADILVVESTYGDRDNPMDNPLEQFEEVVKRAMDRNGCLLIPAFSVGRTQLLLYYLHELFLQKRIDPDIQVFLDSPMAISATNLHKKYFDYHKLDEFTLSGQHAVFDYKKFQYVQKQSDSMQLNYKKNRAIIISASGMCTGGRIMHHLYNRLQNEQDTIMFVGYQAEGTRGRRILDGEEKVRMFGYDIPVKCHVEKIDGLSAHADRQELFSWLDNFTSSPKQTFTVHGEEKVLQKYAAGIREKGWNVSVPEYQETFSVFEGI